MSALSRTYWLAVGLVVYVATGSLYRQPSLASTLVAAAIPLGLVWIWNLTQPGKAQASWGAAGACLRLAAAGAGVWLAARIGAPQEATLELAATTGVGITATSTVYALARIPATDGLLKPRAALRSMDATAFVLVLWTVALVVAAVKVLNPQGLVLDPLTLDYTATAASIGSLLVLVAATWRVRHGRRLELGTGDRASGALALCTTALAVAVPSSAIDLAPPDRVMPVAVLLACLTTLWTLLAEDARRVAIVLRASLVLAVLGVPTALLTGAFAKTFPANAGLAGLLGCAVALAVGVLTRSAARPLAPERSRWLDAIADASQRALLPEPQPAIIATLGALKATAASPTATPALFLRDPPIMQSVDVAGYLHETPADAPEEIYELAAAEPLGTIRAEVLESVSVRHPKVRPLLQWLQVRGAFSATLVNEPDGPVGFLLLPRGDRRTPMTLEEASAVRALADRLSALLIITSAMSRARQREYEALDQARRWKTRCDEVSLLLDGQRARHTLHAQQLARPLLSTTYGQAARQTLSRLELEVSPPNVRALIVPRGVDATPWAAAAHLALQDVEGSLVVVDAAYESESELEKWRTPHDSPLSLAARGTLLLFNIELAPEGFQLLLADLLSHPETPTPSGRRSSPPAPQTVLKKSEVNTTRGLGVPLPRTLLLALSSSSTALAHTGQLVPALASLIHSPTVELPGLLDRPEDLRALVLATLARVSARPKHETLGISRRALQALMDYDWPGNDAELEVLLRRASALTTGPQLTLEDLLSAGFPAPKHEVDRPPPSSHSPSWDAGSLGRSDTGPRRRPRPRRARRPH